MLTSDPNSVLLALGVAGIGAIAIYRVLTGLIEQETRIHDTAVKVAQLQLKYLERARAFRESIGVVGTELAGPEEEPIEVGEAEAD